MFRALMFATATAVCGAVAAAEPAPAPAVPASAPAASTPDSADRRVIEDDGVRIEETRVRGQLSRVTVQSKLAGRTGPVGSYEIIVGPGGRDPSQKNAQGASGQRAWSVLKF